MLNPDEVVSVTDKSLAQLYKVLPITGQTLSNDQRSKMANRARMLITLGYAFLQRLEPETAETGARLASEDLEEQCANCGCPKVTIYHGNSLYDGEGVCSRACLDEHDDLGCPLEQGAYRACPH